MSLSAPSVARREMSRFSIFAFSAIVFSLGIAPAFAGDPASVLPDDNRDESIQSPAQFFGFDIGSRHLRHHQVVDYWKYLADRSERVSLLPYGRTHGKRPLLVAVITAPDNSSRLKAVGGQRKQLTSGDFTGDLQQQLLVMYLGYSVHGDEASGVNAAPLVAYHLASSQSEQVEKWLQQGVYLLDPALNPDGIDRFANWANEVRGRFPSASSLDREHVQPWPGGRTNYYWFDLNRDWLPLVHPESRGRLNLFHTWKPNVVLDFHEMSGRSSFFFQPGIPARNNPLTPNENLELTRKFASEHARSMDAAGETYYTEERFDDFYMGKGSTYPDLHGAIGILFEQGSTRGLRLKNSRTNRHFRDTVANQVRTSLSSLRAANENRQSLLEFQVNFYRDALQQARDDSTRAYVLSGTASRIRVAASLMVQHAIQVYQPPSSIVVEGVRHLENEVLIVPTQQPEYLFIRSLMEPLQDFRENIFYDVSTWHLPSALDLTMHRFESDLPATWTEQQWTRGARHDLGNRPLSKGDKRAEPQLDEVAPANEAQSSHLAGFAFEPLELEAPKLAAALQRAGVALRVTTEEFRMSENGRVWPRGTFVVLKQGNQPKWPKICSLIDRLAEQYRIPLEQLESSLTTNGPDLGSDTLLDIPRCNPLLVVGEGTRSYSAGNIWHFLDHRMSHPATLVDSGRLLNVDLRDYSCVILPEGTYSGWSQPEVEQLQQYVRDGGTVIAVASAVRWLAANGVIKPDEPRDEPEKDLAETTASPKPKFADARDKAALESIAGAFLQVQADRTHPLAYGIPDALVPVFRDHELKFELPENPYQTVATYHSVLAGYVSQNNRRRLLGSTAVWVEPRGSGRIILLVDNPVFRGFVRGSERFLTNAILLGPAIRIPSAPGSDADDAAAGQAGAHGH